MINPEDIRERARALLENGEVKSVLGFQKGTADLMSRPAFVSRPEDARTLTWDPTCVHNLASYLVGEIKRPAVGDQEDGKPVAIVAKGCDSRAIVVLLQENFLKREDVHIIGVSCEGTGVLDRAKLAGHLDGRTPLGAEFSGDDGFVIATDEGEIAIAAREVLADRCLECRAAFPAVNDIVFGDKAGRDLDPPFRAVDAFEESHEGREWEFWKGHFERCIRCYACRSVCPMCYCEECVVDSISLAVSEETTAEQKANRVRWIEKSPVSSENFGYHLVRAIHLVGRCVDCGECERVCPVGIPLRLINTKLEREAREMLGYEPGLDPQLPSLFSSFRDDDPNDFIR